MTDCVFCKIVKGEIPCHRVYEDERTFAFLDINPVARGHTLVIPKAHHQDIFDAPSEDVTAVAQSAKKVAEALVGGLGAEGVNILHASGSAAEQSVFHLHLHVIPRRRGDGIDAFPKPSAQKTDLKEVAALIRRGL